MEKFDHRLIKIKSSIDMVKFTHNSQPIPVPEKKKTDACIPLTSKWRNLGSNPALVNKFSEKTLQRALNLFQRKTMENHLGHRRVKFGLKKK